MREQFVVVEPARTVKVPGSNLKELVAPKKLAFRRTEFGVMMSVDGSRDEMARFIRDTYDWLEYKLKERSEKAKQLSERYGPTPEGPLP